MFTIRQTATGWEVLDAAGTVLASHRTYDDALAQIGELLRSAQLAAVSVEVDDDGDAIDGLLPERWTSSTGIAFSEPTGDGRDFTGCVWSSRDPAVYPLPLMLQTETEIGHFGAVLAGFMDTCDTGSDAPTGSGRFYDTDAGEQLRDMLLGGRRTGVSVDPGPATAAEVVCTQMDDDGWCEEAETHFTAYEIIGLTATPFPAFANATIELAAAAAPAPVQPAESPAPADGGQATFAQVIERPTAVAAGAHLAAPIAPPAAWFAEPEPDLGDDRLVEQEDGTLAVPLTITDDGAVYGHVARWGQCHVGYPGVCVSPPESSAGYPGFNLGHVRCADGEDVTTGALIMGMDHPALSLRAAAARDAYAHSGVAWADVHATSGQFGPWVAGALRPDVTDLQLRILRASALSGDWREDETTGRIELVATLAVNVPGFPIARQAIAASGLIHPTPQPRAQVRGHELVALTASGLVSRCPECTRRARAAAASTRRPGADRETARRLDRMESLLVTLERRTRPLRSTAADELAARIRRDA